MVLQNILEKPAGLTNFKDEAIFLLSKYNFEYKSFPVVTGISQLFHAR